VITPEQILNFVSLYENKITGWGYINQTKCLFSSWAKTYYKEYGISLPSIDWPRPKRNPSKKYKRPSNELRQATIQWYKDLETKNPQQWCMVTMAIQFGMRWGDVERSKMEWFNDGHLDYSPKKTEGRTNAPRSVRWPHSEDLFERLKKALNGQSHISGDRCTKDRMDDHNQIIQEMRQIGWQEFRAPFHELRKLCVDAIYRAGGLEKAVQISGDNAQTVIAFYSDPRLENIKPVDITDII